MIPRIRTMRYLLSMIGIGPYEKVRVHVPWSSAPPDGEKYTYHQERLRKEIHADRLWLIGTEKALEAHSRQLSHARAIAIPPGLEEAEIWEIANQITSALGGFCASAGRTRFIWI
jgi:hypothetical protein